MIHRFGNEYATGDGFNGFSGIIAQSDSVEDFTINVYDKNHTQIYTHDIISNFNWEIENIGMLYGVNYVEFPNFAICSTNISTKKLKIFVKSGIFY